MRFGSSSRSSAPVEDSTSFSSKSNPGRGRGREPVAMRMFRAVSFLAPPEAPALTWTTCGSRIAPSPATSSTLFFFSKNATPRDRVSAALREPA